ncbi:uncharacterized protein I303_105071 [Kwoniella dejecticola CBS 10117]|uniref:Uncharacterized protein n=1 Tax=Kwoniella dejecticola CBS 10117 TaxID=1296121 RepID=A0A1A6A3J0_9TREE|nr:uncharacterized protein I303_05483 [Kwoniella dejecticola CBS 10117]OBR84624.1 hypothetical protein I303_05483 [Kwoniella dejecticola CBS 10117]
MTLSDRPAIPIPLDIVELIPSANGTATARAVRDTSIASQTVPPMHSSATPAAATAAPTPASTAVTDQRWIPISTTSSISSPGIVSSQPAAVPQMDPKKPISSADLSGNRKNKEGKLKTKWTQLSMRGIIRVDIDRIAKAFTPRHAVNYSMNA